MMRAFGGDPHLLEGQADLAAHILSLVEGRDIHIARVIVGDVGAFTVFVGFKEIELQLRLEMEGIPLFARIFHRLLEQCAGIRPDRRTVCIVQSAEHPHDLAVLGAPRQNGDGRRLRVEPKILAVVAAVAGDIGRVDRDTDLKGALHLAALDGNILLNAVNIAKSKPDELDVLLFDILHDFLLFVRHKITLSIW